MFLHGFPEGFCDLGWDLGCDMLWHGSKKFFSTWDLDVLIFPIDGIPLSGVGHVI